MATSINMGRIAKRIRELYQGKIDMSDFPNDSSNHFETRALAAVALEMVTDLDSQQASIQITDG